jgi:plastocyanin domain-containing protein
MRIVAVLVLVTALVAGCDKKKTAPAPKAVPATAGTVGTDGVRRVEVLVDKKGYTPAEVAAKPNEKLILVMTRKVEGDCLSQIVIGDQEPIDLPMNQAVEIPVTAPASGAITWACGMGMYHGAIAVGAS